MLIQLDRPKLLSDAIALVSELILEAKIKVSKEGLELTAMDPANVALVSLKIPSSVFSKFEVKETEELAVNLDDLKQVLRRVPATASLVIEKKENSLCLKIGKRTFNIALISLESEEKQIPKLSFSSEVELSSAYLAEAINDAAIVSDSCSFIANKNSFIVEARGSLNSARTEFDSNEAKIKSDTESKAKYGIDYLTKFMKASKIASNVKVSFSTDYPAKFDFKDSDVEITFILAPRSEE
ncbi:proliferating cell nuclear antigen (pcna) [Candidatus Pacearchaeota archaeon ex4484_31]|nr:MAG: proliferating cell nuclear antigen (pcna) [Candidatus Pacearchaeota archaeon ex4484_31]